MTNRWRWTRWRRDTVLFAFGISIATTDILFFGARASTLTFALGLLLSPLVLGIDERRKGQP